MHVPDVCVFGGWDHVVTLETARLMMERVRKADEVEGRGAGRRVSLFDCSMKNCFGLRVRRRERQRQIQREGFCAFAPALVPSRLLVFLPVRCLLLLLLLLLLLVLCLLRFAGVVGTAGAAALAGAACWCWWWCCYCYCWHCCYILLR